MFKYLAFSILIFLLVPVKNAEAASTDSGSGIYQVLRNNNLLDNYMVDAVGEIAGTIVTAAGRWPGFRINQPYSDSIINIYLIDSERLPEANILEQYGVKLAKYSLRGNALAHEETNILFVDTVLLKSLVTAAQLFANQNIDTMNAVAAIRAYGIGNYRQLWDPKINSVLDTAGYTDNWAMLASGALAFILAHEIGHIALGAKNVEKRRSWMKFKGKEDRDKRWACSDLVEEKYRHQQQIEQEADNYAVSLLSKVLFPPGVLVKPLLRYELGARWYIVYSLASQMVETLFATESKNIHTGLRLQFGAEIYNKLIAEKNTTGRGSIKVFFPKSHPANIRRASVSLKRLAQSPYSLYQGGSSTDQKIMIFEMFLDMECRNLKAKYE
jgi:hypothetical protein